MSAFKHFCISYLKICRCSVSLKYTLSYTRAPKHHRVIHCLKPLNARVLARKKYDRYHASHQLEKNNNN